MQENLIKKFHCHLVLQRPDRIAPGVCSVIQSQGRTKQVKLEWLVIGELGRLIVEIQTIMILKCKFLSAYIVFPVNR